jgi:CDGSH-type Zn-finger protein
MAREVTHTEDGPIYLDEDDVDPEKGDIAVCLCGLSDEHPFCDGSHRAVEDEPEGRRFKYVDGERREIASIEYVGDREEGDDGDGESAPNGSDGPTDADAPGAAGASASGEDEPAGGR